MAKIDSRFIPQKRVHIWALACRQEKFRRPQNTSQDHSLRSKLSKHQPMFKSQPCIWRRGQQWCEDMGEASLTNLSSMRLILTLGSAARAFLCSLHHMAFWQIVFPNKSISHCTHTESILLSSHWGTVRVINYHYLGQLFPSVLMQESIRLKHEFPLHLSKHCFYPSLSSHERKEQLCHHAKI